MVKSNFNFEASSAVLREPFTIHRIDFKHLQNYTDRLTLEVDFTIKFSEKKHLKKTLKWGKMGEPPF